MLRPEGHLEGKKLVYLLYRKVNPQLRSRPPKPRKMVATRRAQLNVVRSEQA